MAEFTLIVEGVAHREELAGRQAAYIEAWLNERPTVPVWVLYPSRDVYIGTLTMKHSDIPALRAALDEAERIARAWAAERDDESEAQS